MYTYVAKEFDLPELDGISKKQIDTHLKLYQGYVKHTNRIHDKVRELIQSGLEEHSYEISELWRRFGFEFDGMRNHEYYFGALEGGSTEFDPESEVGKAIINHFGSYDGFLTGMKFVSKTRGSVE